MVCINKMDLVDWSEDAFNAVVADFSEFASRLRVHDLSFVPVSALQGDNVVERGDNSPWYDGAPLLSLLEHLYVASDRNLVDVRFPVQYVIRPQSHEHRDFRGYAGTVASGVLRPGDPVLALPTGFTTSIASIETADGPVEEAYPPMAVIVRLADDIDLSRGDLLCRPQNAPSVTRTSTRESAGWTSRHRCCRERSTRSSRPPGPVGRWSSRSPTGSTSTPCIATRPQRTRAERHRPGQLRTTVPFFVDNYTDNRATGSFILVDESTNRTVAAGMIDVHRS